MPTRVASALALVGLALPGPAAGQTAPNAVQANPDRVTRWMAAHRACPRAAAIAMPAMAAPAMAATLVKLEGHADPLAPLLEGKAHALLVTTPTPKLVVDRAPGRLFMPFEDAPQRTTTAMAIRKGAADFLHFLNSWLAFHTEDGWLDERQQYWFRGAE